MNIFKIHDQINKVTVTIASLAFLIIIGIAVWLYFKARNDYYEIGLSSNTIGSTPTLVDNMREIGQWEFLAVNDEELVDTVRKGFFSDDELVRIYYGTLRIGLDFSLCDEDWVRVDGDSIILNLPPVKLLDEDFLDEARSRSFHESGKWSSKDREALADIARTKMRTRCLTKANLEQAQKNAEQQVRTLVRMIKRGEAKSND